MTFIQDIKKPFNFITFILAIVGIVLSIIFYLKAEKEKSLVYYKLTDNAIIYNNLNPNSKFKVITNDSIIINKNIYLTEFVLWNNGDFAIDSTDLRKLYKIQFDSVKILDYSIQTEVRPNYSRFVLSKLGIDSNYLTLSWKYFDPKQAIKIQIIYISNSSKEIKFSSNILGIQNINEVKPTEKVSMFSIIFTSIFILFFSVFSTAMWRISNKDRFDKIMLTSILFGICILMLYVIKSLFFSTTQFPIM